MLVAMGGAFPVRTRMQDMHPFWGFVRAFAEAAMVGGLADWFAVTALFRHPLGLPIPHTAIIPRNKDRIGDTLAVFLKDNFLTASVVARRLRTLDVAGRSAAFLRIRPGKDGCGRGRAVSSPISWRRSIRSALADGEGRRRQSNALSSTSRR
jgi:uncharacterized membrane-anchored protein YjiN (DUF445 family)